MWKLISAVLMGFAVVLTLGCGSDDSRLSGGKDTNLAPKRVVVSKVTARDFKRMVRSNGSLVAKQKAVLRALQDGPIVEMNVDIGMQVRKGQQLFRTRGVDARLAVETSKARLDTATATLEDLLAWRRSEEVEIRKAMVAQAQAELERLQNERERARTLLEKGAISASQWDVARTAADNAEANFRIQKEQLQIAEEGPTPQSVEIASRREKEARVALLQAQQSLEDTSIKAPFSGTITARLSQVGDFARRGDEILEIKQLEVLHAELEIPERYASTLSIEVPVQLTVESASLVREGEVVAVNDSIDTRTRTFKVKVRMENSDRQVKAGAFCTAHFSLPAVENGKAVPSTAVHNREGRTFVWVVQNGKAVREIVTTGEELEGWVEIQSGLSGDEQIIVEGAGALSSEDNVEIMSEEG
jgi:multidrug efflux pump subunit AcrA (membrane-fusion protein)